MATYQDIENANKALSPIDIKGKSYMEVNQRIKAFRMVYPEGYITTEMVSNDGGICIFKAEVGYRDPEYGRVPLSTGTAYEKEGSTFINKTSYIENCETSAIGRALGMAGFGIDTSVASAEEVQNAMANQDQKKTEETRKQKLRKIDIDSLKKRFPQEDQQTNILSHFKIKSFEDMTVGMLMELNEKANKEEKK